MVLFASGAHAIYSLDGKKKSKPAEIKIGRHVWIGQGARIVQGARIGKNSVIGSYSLVAGDVPNNCTAGGNPAKVLSRDIFWTVGDYGEDYFAHSKINNEKSIWSESTNKKGEIIFE